MATIVDCSMPIRTHWRWKPELVQLAAHARGDRFQTSVLRVNVHGFTHVDAQLHYVPGAPSIDRVPLDIWVGEAAVLDVSHRGASEGITAADLAAAGPHVRAGDIALVRTDWDARCSFETKEFWSTAPYFTREAAEWLRDRRVRAVGSDFPPDYPIRFEVVKPERPPAPEDYVTHEFLLKHGIFLIEYLVNLKALTRPRVQFLAVPIKIEGSDGAPARAFAILD